MSSMIQSYVMAAQNRRNRRNVNPAYNQDSLRTYVKQYKPKGHLIKSNPFSPIKMVKSDAEALKFFFKGIQGKGNDHSVGRINDVAIKLGSLGIAGMLAASSGSPLNRGMEFIGMICWLGAMSLWPKLAINLPIKLTKGVDLNLEYENSVGQKKKFFQDPQFICWDLMSDDEINKMGDKLGIPANIKNRKSAIENKARQVAIQGNTLMLSTAGFATPLIASLAADRIGKSFYSKAIEKTQDMKASAMQKRMLEGINTLIKDEEAEGIFVEKLGKNITQDTRKFLLDFYNKKMPQGFLREEIAQTVDNILQNADRAATLKLDDKFTFEVAQKVMAQKYPNKAVNDLVSDEMLNSFKEIAANYKAKYGDFINNSSINEYIASVEKMISDKNIMNSKKSMAIPDIIRNLYNNHKIANITFSQTAIDNLKQLSDILDIYNLKIFKDFGNYSKIVLNGNSSSNAFIWEQASHDLFKAFEIDSKTLNKMAHTPFGPEFHKILRDAVDKVVADPLSFDSAMEKLGKIAAKLSAKNEKNVDFALQYLDSIQRIFSKCDRTGGLDSIVSELERLVASNRMEVLSKYMSANNTIFAPIRLLSVLNEARFDPNINYDVLKQILLNSQNSETFICKFDNFQNVIRNKADYKKYMDYVWSGLSDSAKQNIPEKLAKTIDANTNIMKVMLTSLSDDVNIKFPVSSGDEVKNALKGTKFAKYIDEYFNLSFAAKSDGTIEIANKIAKIIEKDVNKIDELSGILKLSPSEVANVKKGQIQVVYDALYGTQKAGQGYIKNGRFRFKNILEFLRTKNIDELGDFTISASKVGKVTNMEGKNMAPLFKDSARKIYTYQSWLKRVGFSFVALCAITAFAISKIGKKNEFNPDIYKERGMA